MSRDFFTTAERAALDRAAAPALPPGFADALVSTALARPAAAPPRRPIGLLWREWRRGTRILFGFGALALAGAAAAAAGSGMLMHLPERLPQLAAAVGLTPVPQFPEHVARHHRPRPPAAAEAPPPAATPEVAQAFPPPLPDAQIARRRARVAAYREAVLAGEVPPLPPRVRRLLAWRVRARIEEMPPERRAALQTHFAAMTPEQRVQAQVAMEARFLANHPLLAERLREREAMVLNGAGDVAEAGSQNAASLSDKVEDAPNGTSAEVAPH